MKQEQGAVNAEGSQLLVVREKLIEFTLCTY